MQGSRGLVVQTMSGTLSDPGDGFGSTRGLSGVLA